MKGVAAPLLAARRATRDPDMVRLQAAWGAVMTASWAVTVSLMVVAYDAGGSAAVALAVLVRAAASALLGPAVGSLVDRAPRHRSLRWAAVTCSAGAAGAAVAGSVLVPVVLLATVVGLAIVVFRTAQSAVLPEMLDEPTDLAAANVLSSAVESVGLFVGPALAGVLLAVQGPRLSFAVACALFAAAFAALATTRRRPQPVRLSGEVAAASTRELLRLRAPRLLLLLVLAQTTVGGGLVVLYAALAVEMLGVQVGAVGLLSSAFGLGCVLGSLGLFALAGSSRLGLWTVVALLLWALPLLVVPAAPGLQVVLALLVVVGGGNVLLDVTITTLLQRGVPSRLMGRAFGALETVVVLGVSAGALLAPPLERLVGPAWAIVALATPLALVALVGLRPLRRLDRELAAPVRQIALLQHLAPCALLPTPELEALALRLQRHECSIGDVVVRQGERGATFFVVESGTFTTAVDGRDAATLGPRDSFGETTLLLEGVRTATITARTPAVVWSLEGTHFVSALRCGDGRTLTAADGVIRADGQHAAPAPAPPEGS